MKQKKPTCWCGTKYTVIKTQGGKIIGLYCSKCAKHGDIKIISVQNYLDRLNKYPPKSFDKSEKKE